MRTVPSCQRYLGHRMGRRPERDGGGLESSSADIFSHPFPDRRSKNAMKMVRRKMGHLGEALEGQVAVEMLLDIELDSQDAVSVRSECWRRRVRKCHGEIIGGLQRRRLIILAVLSRVSKSSSYTGWARNPTTILEDIIVP